MVWDPVWDKVFQATEWGKYPPEELVRFVARNFHEVSDRKAVRILEIGCGAGANIIFLAREGFSATGVEGSKVAIERVYERLEADGFTADIRQADGVNLPFGDDQFDCVVDIACLCCNDIEDTKKILAEAHRVLKPGGVFFSKTFATGITGEDTAEKVEGKSDAYVKFVEGPLTRDMGLIRLLSESKISALYGMFDELTYDYVIRTDKAQAHIIKDWLISGRKQKAA